VYVRSTAISTVLFSPSLFSLVHISTVFIRDNISPKDLKNFPYSPLYECLQVSCDSLWNLSCTGLTVFQKIHHHID
jgi:hypothetical protein